MIDRAPPRVAIVDSGVDANHPSVRGKLRIEPGPSFTANGIDDPRGGLRDHLGHGTAVAATIARFAVDAEVISLRVFDRDAVCDFAAVLAALEHAIGLAPALVNLSLGTTSLRHRAALERLVAQAAERGTRIVAPASYGGLPCDPGSLAAVEAVVADPNVAPAWPELRPHGGRLVWFASPLPPPGPDGTRTLLARGDSLAVANVTGCLLRSRR